MSGEQTFTGVAGNPYRNFGTALLQHFTRDKGTNVLRWNIQDNDIMMIYRFYFKLIGHETLEKILEFVNRYHGKIRMYSEEHSTVVEFKVMKQTVDGYNKGNR